MNEAFGLASVPGVRGVSGDIEAPSAQVLRQARDTYPLAVVAHQRRTVTPPDCAKKRRKVVPSWPGRTSTYARGP